MWFPQTAISASLYFSLPWRQLHNKQEHKLYCLVTEAHVCEQLAVSWMAIISWWHTWQAHHRTIQHNVMRYLRYLDSYRQSLRYDTSVDKLQYTLRVKKDQRYFSFITLPNVDRFWNSSTFGLSKEFAIKSLSSFPPHFNYVIATLPCEM